MPDFVKVRARDVKPFHYALWCTVEGSAPFANTIVSVQWAEDGKLSWMLDSFNFYFIDPDEEIELIESDESEAVKAQHTDWVLPLQGCTCRCDPLTGRPITDPLCSHHGDADAVAAEAERLRAEAEQLAQHARRLRGAP